MLTVGKYHGRFLTLHAGEISDLRNLLQKQELVKKTGTGNMT